MPENRPESHPRYWKVKAHIHANGEAQLRARMAAQLAQSANAELAKAMTEHGLDPKADYIFDDEAETITVKAREEQP